MNPCFLLASCLVCVVAIFPCIVPILCRWNIAWEVAILLSCLFSCVLLGCFPPLPSWNLYRNINLVCSFLISQFSLYICFLASVLDGFMKFAFVFHARLLLTIVINHSVAVNILAICLVTLSISFLPSSRGLHGFSFLVCFLAMWLLCFLPS